MKLKLFILFFLIISNGNAQIIIGKIIDSLSQKPLAYVNISLLKTTTGTVTNEEGYFELDIPKKQEIGLLRIGAIGYEEKLIKLSDFTNNPEIIRLNPKPFQLEEVVLNTKSRNKRKVGTTKKDKKNICGWGGNQFGKGHEIGLQINLGKDYVHLLDINIYLYKQNFKKSLFRLHIRELDNNGIPLNELLTKDILLNFDTKSGWLNFDLKPYHIFLKGKVAVSIEWVKAWQPHDKKRITVNSKKNVHNVLLAAKNNSGIFYIRKGIEMPWKIIIGKTPVINLTVQ